MGILCHPSSSGKGSFNAKYNWHSRGRRIGSLQDRREVCSTVMDEFLRRHPLSQLALKFARCANRLRG